LHNEFGQAAWPFLCAWNDVDQGCGVRVGVVKSESEAILVLLVSESVKMSRLRPQYKFQRLRKSQKSYLLNILYFHQRELEITPVLSSVSRKTRNKT
jgi:hypothetical protein